MKSESSAPPCGGPELVAQMEQGRWFAEEVLPHETMLRAYLRRHFPSLGDVDDVVQESYLRLIRARAEGRLRSVKGLLFTAARNAAVDIFRRKGSFAPTEVDQIDGGAVLDNRPGVVESISRSQELDLLAEAVESLAPRCREVLKLRKIYGLSHREIARVLGISEGTVHVQVGRGMRRCVEFMEARGLIAKEESDAG